MSEDPKQFLRNVAPKRIAKALIHCPIQGEEDRWGDLEADNSYALVEIDGNDVNKLPPEAVQTGIYDDTAYYDWEEAYVYEILGYCYRHGIKILGAYERFPDNGIMVDAYLDWTFRRQQEAEDPKKFLRQASSSKIWPSENYFLNLWKDGQSWEDGEFCPGQINEHNQFMTFDAMYGLVDDIYAAMGVNREPTAAEETRFTEEDNRYWGPIHDDIKRGITSGTVDGIAGRYHWQIVYDPSREDDNRDPHVPFETWTSQLIKVRPGEQYGTRITPKSDRSRWIAFGGDINPNESLAHVLAAAILDGEDPKSVFKMLGTRETAAVDIFRYLGSWPEDRKQPLGKLVFYANGRLAPGSDDMDLPPEVIQYVYRQLRRGSLNGTIDERAVRIPIDPPLYFHLHGTTSYGRSSEKLGRFIDPYIPELVVETPGWTIRFPLYVDDQWGTFTWKPSQAPQPLTDEQRHFMQEHGENIYLGMNEGDEFEGTLVDYIDLPDDAPEDQSDEVVVGKWHVEGDPDKAPEGPMGNEGYG